jgi:hypothetical protein
MGVLIFIIVFVVFFAGIAILNGWALSILWGWFVVPVFDVPQLGVVSAIGVAMVVTYLTASSSTETKKEDASKVLLATVLRPLIALLFGLIVKQFM